MFMTTRKLSSVQRLQEAALMVATLFTLYIALALLSFNHDDASWLHATQQTVVRNSAGSVGAWLADTLFFILGRVAYAIPVITLSLTGLIFYRHRNGQTSDNFTLILHILGGKLTLLTTCGLASVTLNEPDYFNAGGVVGSLLTQVMLPWFNQLGTLLVLFFFWAVGVTLFSGLSWLAIAQRFGALLLDGRASLTSLWCSLAATVSRKSKAEVVQPPIHADRLTRVSFETMPPFDHIFDVLPSSSINPLPPAAVKQQRSPQEPVAYSTQPLSSRLDDQHASLTTPCDRRLPKLELLTATPAAENTTDLRQGDLEKIAMAIEARLADYRVQAEVMDISPGPVITRYELRLAPGVKAARISTLARDLARSLSVVAVRVVEVIPGKPYVGLELPNKHRQTVYLREVLNCSQFTSSMSPLTMVLGKDIAGQPLVADLTTMPHLLVAGTTGSGKSVGVNAMILSMLYKSTPDEVRFIMVDPKMLELSVYEGIPHLLTPVVTDMKDAANALRWCVNEMERRYKLMSLLGMRNLSGYNERIQQAEKLEQPIANPLWRRGDSMESAVPPVLGKLPYIVVLIDEFADLMMVEGKKVEELIARLAQKARAAGIHLVLATQRPSVDVITGLIKANIPTRIAFTVSSKIDSRTILDQPGAESLLGMGDMLYLPPNSSLPVRVHGAFVRDQEVHAVVRDWKSRSGPNDLKNILADTEDSDSTSQRVSSDHEWDQLFDQAVAFVAESRRGSISSVQRKFKIGYNRAARIIEQMEAEGIVSAPGNSGNRSVLLPASARE